MSDTPSIEAIKKGTFAGKNVSNASPVGAAHCNPLNIAKPNVKTVQIKAPISIENDSLLAGNIPGIPSLNAIHAPNMA